MKDERHLRPCPDDAPWKPRFDEAISLAGQAQWPKAAELLAELAQQVDEAPAVWRNLATLRGWTADTPGCIQALRKFATLDVPLEDAVEAEALSLFLSDDPLGDQLDVWSLRYSVDDPDRLRAALSSASRAVEVRTDPASLADDDGPPPMAVYLLFDRARLDPGAQLTAEAVPRVLCQASLYGKETDRDARLELPDVVACDLDQLKALLAELDADTLNPQCEPEVIGHVSATQEQLARRWRLPEGSSQEDVERLSSQHVEKTMLETWPQSPSRLLDGKSPLEAADQEAYRVRLLAAIMVLEFWLEQTGSRFDFNRLRSRLGLPTLEPLDPQQIPVEELPLVRWSRVMVDKLSDEALLKAFGRAFGYNARVALRNLALAVTERPSLDGREEQLLAFEVTARMADDSTQSIEYLDRGRRAAERAGRSSASWDLMELSFRAGRQESHEVSRLLNHLRSEHINEPGVAQALTDFFIQVGVLRPDGTVAAPAAAPTTEESSLAIPGEAAAEPGELWTPDSQKPADQKPKIWTPGMD